MTGSDRRGPPWDPAVGLRVGVFVGGLLGAVIVGVFGVGGVWTVLLGGAIGAAVGYWSQRPGR